MSDRPETVNRGWTATDTVTLIACGALLLFMRAHAWSAPLETDECNYLYIGERLADGDRLYVDVWDHQPPAMFCATALMSYVCGTGENAYRSLSSGVSLISLVVVFLIARNGLGRGAALMSALVFALCSSDPGMAGEGGNRELFMNALILGAFAALARNTNRFRPGGVFAAGVLLGLASLFKTVAVAHWVALLVWMWTAKRDDERGASSIGIRLTDAAIFGAGPVLLWAGTWGYFAATGRNGAFIDAVFSYNLGYSGIESSFLSRFGSFFVHADVFRTAWALWVFGGVGVILLPWQRARRFSTGVSLMVLGSCLAICLPGRFWPHYYYLLFPWLAIAAGSPVARLGNAGFRKWGVGAAIAALCFASQYRSYLRLPPDEIARFRYGVRMAWARDQGRRLGEVTNPDDTVYVYGSDAGIYYYAGRRCATRFTMIEAVSAEREGVERRRDQFMEDFVANRPRVVLITEAPFAEFMHYLQQEYQEAGWDRGAGADRPPRMQVLTDRRRPIVSIDWDWTDE